MGGRAGAMPQRLLWASTGVKDPAYSPTLYVDELIGPDTVNTMPPATMDAFRENGTIARTIDCGVNEAREILAQAEKLGLQLDGITASLVRDGLKQFEDAADALLGVVADKRAHFLGDRLNRMQVELPDTLSRSVDARLEWARTKALGRRLHVGDASLWTDADESGWLGWLSSARGEQPTTQEISQLGSWAKGRKDAVLLGMGGSSLGPEVFARIFGAQAGYPTLHVLDTTNPEQIARVAEAIDPTEALFIVASKSGSTLEPELLRAYFWELSGKDGSRFVAVTDPGSQLEQTAARDGYAQVVLGDPEIGGRFSVLSAFGMVPAAIMGLDVSRLFTDTAPMVLACDHDVPPANNPGISLGAILGEAALAGHDKLTILTSPRLISFGGWLEQLVAESTGKQGKGIIPVDLETLSAAQCYGDDRLFVHFRLAGDRNADLDARLEAICSLGHPVLRIEIPAIEQIGQEFFRWEIATAVAGAVIGINPFDQPDVEDAKIATRNLVNAYEQSGRISTEVPSSDNKDIALYASDKSLTDMQQIIAAHFSTVEAGHYAGFLAFIAQDQENADVIERMRETVGSTLGIATVAGFGPRFLHSTGQIYKGGPGKGTFIVITQTEPRDLPVPGRKASFGTVQLAQALGDIEVLRSRGQKVLRVHLKSPKGLLALEQAVAAALNPFRTTVVHNQNSTGL